MPIKVATYSYLTITFQWWKDAYKSKFKCLGRLGNILSILVAYCLTLFSQENGLLLTVRFKNCAIIIKKFEIKSNFSLSDHSWLWQPSDNRADNWSHVHIPPEKVCRLSKYTINHAKKWPQWDKLKHTILMQELSKSFPDFNLTQNF